MEIINKEKFNKYLSKLGKRKQEEYDKKWKEKLAKPFGEMIRKLEEDDDVSGIALSLETSNRFIAQLRVEWAKDKLIPFAQSVSKTKLKLEAEEMYLDLSNSDLPVFRLKIVVASNRLNYLKNDCITNTNIFS